MSDPAPHKEPERQYYFIEKAKEYVRKEAEEAGRPMTFCVTTFGCQMNARDSEKLRGILLEIGYEEAAEEEADFVIFNTCSVRENANTRVYGRLGQLKSHKKKNPHMKIALCGCMMQEPEVVEKLRTSYRFVDLIFGTHNIYKFAELITVAAWSLISGKIRIRLSKIFQTTGNIPLNPESTLCLAATISVVTVSCHM